MFTTQKEAYPAPGCAIPWANTERTDREPDFPKKENTSLIFTEINGWEKSAVSSRKVVRARELFPWFLCSGLVWLFACGVLQRSLLRELP